MSKRGAGGMDKMTREQRSATMSAIRSDNTSIEVKMRRELWRRGARYRKNVKSLFGKPDIAVKKKKVAVFFDSCFWHGCELHFRPPKSNLEYWENKLERNKRRDEEVSRHYEAMGWKVERVWEHDIKHNFEEAVGRVEKLLSGN